MKVAASCASFGRIAVVGLTAMALSSCGNLSVTMEVLNPDVVQRQEDKSLVTTGLPQVLGATDDGIDADVRKLKAAHRQGYEKIRALYAADAVKLSGSAADSLRRLAELQLRDFEANVKSQYSDLAKDLKQYREDLKRVLRGKYSVTPQDPEYLAALEILRTWQQRVIQFRALIREDVGKFVTNLYASPHGVLSPAQVEVLNSGLAAIKDELAQISIQNSPHAYAVASALRADWSEGYNQVYTNGYLGATEVAIKLDPQSGNYLLKGLSFDPSDVAAVASKVTTQAFLLAAQVAGVPVKLATSPAAGSTGAALAGSSGALADAQARLEAQRALDQARKAALLAIARAIVNEETELGGSDEQRKAAMAAIRNAFQSKQAILRPSTTP